MGLASLTGRLRLRTKLLVVVLVPLAAMALFAGMWAHQRLDTARAAEADRTRVDLSVALADLMSDVRLDGTFTIALNGDQTIRRLGMGGVIDGLKARDRALRASIASRVADLDAETPMPSWMAARRALTRLAAGRRGFEQGDISIAAVQTLFLEYDRAAAAVEQALFDAARPAPGEPAGQAATLAGLGALEGHAQREMVALNRVAVSRFDRRVDPAPDVRDIGRFATAEDAELRLLLPLLPPRTATALRRWRDSSGEREWAALRARVLAGEVPTLSRALPPALLRSAILAGIRAGLGAELSGMAADTAASARAGFRFALILAISLTVLTLLVALIAVRSVVTTLRRLETNARRISEGDLDVEPVGAGGRDELAVLAGSFDQMTGTLRTLEGQMRALAEGHADAPVLREEIPGALGTALQGSVRRMRDATTRLQASEETSRLIVDTAAEAIWTVGADGVVLSANRASQDLVGRPADALVGRPLADVLRAGGSAWGGATVTNREGVVVRSGGGEIPVLVSARSVADGDECVTTVFARDISERKELERRLAHEATHDSLTGLPNRHALGDLVDAAIAREAERRSGFAVLFVDLDRFKQVNDALGHRSGDDLLRFVSQRLCACVRDTDTVARLGGDEFVVIAESVQGVDEAETLARRLVATVEEPYALDGAEAHVSASVGVLWHAGDAVAAADVVRLADIAMFRAKGNGPGNVAVFDEQMRMAVAERERLEIALRQTIAAGGLTPVFQPIVDLATGRPVSLELLARWRRADAGEVPPTVFIPIAEDSGLIIDIGRWALREGCRRVTGWRDAHPGLDLRVAVNISGLHVTRGDIVADVTDALRATGADAHHLRVELTETHLLDGVGEADEALAELGRMGVGLAIDDFGTGYSSLTYLRRLPVDEVKIDRSFVSGLGRDAQDSSIIAMVGSLGTTLGVGTVAEGVETVGQVEMLLAAGLTRGQGYAFSRPLEAEAVDAWLARSDAPVAVSR